MMSDDVNMIEWAFKGIVSVILSVGAGMWVWLVNKVGRNTDDHNEHVLYAERTFAKSSHVDDSFSRVYSTLNKMSDNIQSMSVVQATLASNVANMATNFQSMTNKMTGSP